MELRPEEHIGVTPRLPWGRAGQGRTSVSHLFGISPRLAERGNIDPQKTSLRNKLIMKKIFSDHALIAVMNGRVAGKNRI